MATLRAAVKTFLEADATLTGYCTGGIWDASELDRKGLTAQTPGVMDAKGRLKPVLLIRWKTATGKEIAAYSERRFVEFYIYDDLAAAAIELVKARLKALLENKKFSAADFGLCKFRWASDLGETLTEIFGSDHPCDMSTYFVDYTRN